LASFSARFNARSAWSSASLARTTSPSASTNRAAVSENAGWISASVCPGCTVSPTSGIALPAAKTSRPAIGGVTWARLPGRAATSAGRRNCSTSFRLVTDSVADRIFHCCSFRKLIPAGASGTGAWAASPADA
jgi:hypothetical protein